jgi:hypothetical protein
MPYSAASAIKWIEPGFPFQGNPACIHWHQFSACQSAALRIARISGPREISSSTQAPDAVFASGNEHGLAAPPASVHLGCQKDGPCIIQVRTRLRLSRIASVTSLTIRSLTRSQRQHHCWLRLPDPTTNLTASINASRRGASVAVPVSPAPPDRFIVTACWARSNRAHAVLPNSTNVV